MHARKPSRRTNTFEHARSPVTLRGAAAAVAPEQCECRMPTPPSTPLRDSRSFVRPFVRFLPALCDPRFAPSPLFSPHVTASQPATAKSRQPCTDAHSNALDTLCFALCHGSDSRRSPSLPFLVSSALMLPDVKGRATIDKGSCRLPPFWSSPARPSAHPMCPPPPPRCAPPPPPMQATIRAALRHDWSARQAAREETRRGLA